MEMVKCTWENCPILKIIDEIGIDTFAECVRIERKKACGLLKDGACMVLAIQNLNHVVTK